MILWVLDTTRSAPARERVLGQRGREARGARPTPRRRPAARRARARPRARPAHVRDGAEVGRRHDHRARRVRGRGQRARRAPPASRQWAMPRSGSISGRDERRPQPGHDQPVDRARVHVALHDHLVARLGERQAGGVVALRGAVDQEPACAPPPRPRPPAAARAGTASARAPRRCPRVSAGMSRPGARSPNASSDPGSAAAPPLWPGTWKRPGSRAA